MARKKKTEVPLQVGSAEKGNRGELCAYGGAEETFCSATAGNSPMYLKRPHKQRSECLRRTTRI